MPWNLILTTLLPIILSPSHPHAPEAHQLLADAHTASVTPPGQPSGVPAASTIDVLTRCLALCLKSQALSGAAPTSTTQALAQTLAELVEPLAPSLAVIP